MYQTAASAKRRPPLSSIINMPQVMQKEPVTNTRRWKGLVLPPKEYVVIRGTESFKGNTEMTNSNKTYHHLLVNQFQKDRLIQLGAALLEQFDVDRTASPLKCEEVDPKTYSLQTISGDQTWFLFTYVSIKPGADLKPSKDTALYVRCIYWENPDSWKKNGVSLTGMRSATDDNMNDVASFPLEGWKLEVV